MTVEKRDGKIEEFNIKNVLDSIRKAARSVKAEISDETLEKMCKHVVAVVSKLDEPIKIVDIQLATEDALMKYNFYDVSRAFHDYRIAADNRRYKQLAITKEMDEKLSGSNIQNQNANVDEGSFGGKKGEMINSYLKNEALEYRINPKFSRLHKLNYLYEHDLDSWALGMHNCESVPFDDLLARGMITRQVVIRPAGSANTAFQLIAVGFQLQSLQEFGGVAATHLDSTMVPYVRLSLAKHYFVAWLKKTKEFTKLNLMELMFDDYKDEAGIWHNRLEDYIIERKDRYFKETGLTKDDFVIGAKNPKIDPDLFQSALYDTIQEVKQGVEGLLHNLNSLQSRSGNQLPFSSINYGLNTTEEGRMVVNAILHNTIKGTGNGMTSIFPCQIFQLKDGVNCEEGDPNFDLFKLAVRSSAQRMYPNYVNCDWTVEVEYFKKSQMVKQEALLKLDTELYHEVAKLPPQIQDKLGFHILEGGQLVMNTVPQPFEVASTMGCRTYNGFDVNFTEEYFTELLTETVKTGQIPVNYLLSGTQKDGRGNICPSTIIMPTYAMEAKRKAEKEGHPEYAVDYFLSSLEKAIGDCKDELIERFNWICAQSPASATFMWENNTMKGYKPEEGIISSFKHGTLAIGQIGLAETLQILIGTDQCSKEGMKLAQTIEELFKVKVAKYKENYKLNFGVYYTPAENLCYTSYEKFTKKYKLIEGVTAYKDENGNLIKRGYFTNSIHVPVWTEIDPYHKIDIESQLTGYSSAGCITYVEIGDNALNNLTGLMEIILYAKKRDIPYFAVNVPISECTVCGSLENIADDACCPICGATPDKINHYARITGYLSTKYQHFNPGKQLERKDRFINIKKLNSWQCAM